MANARASSTAVEPGTPSKPAPFGNYYLLGLIAHGGMADVYRAKRIDGEADAPLLAIKVIRPQLARQPRFVEMFILEGKLAMLLCNPSIVRTLDVGEVQGHHYIAMEYIGGCDLSKALRRSQTSGHRIPVPHAIYIAMCVAEGLKCAHELTDQAGRPLNLVNRDVSPSNVRLSYDGEVKLLDFGIAQALMKFTSEIGVLKGKFSYMSPEQIRGMPLDARSDIFAVGILLHEMLTGEKLFRGDTEFALMEKVRRAVASAPSSFNRRVSAELDAVVAKALQRSVGDRYQTAAELATALRALLEPYGFRPAELRQFVRRQHRGEYAEELEMIQIARGSFPGEERVRATDPEAIATVAAAADSPASLHSGEPLANPLLESAVPDVAKRDGFWARVRSKLRRPGKPHGPD